MHSERKVAIADHHDAPLQKFKVLVSTPCSCHCNWDTHINVLHCLETYIKCVKTIYIKEIYSFLHSQTCSSFDCNKSRQFAVFVHVSQQQKQHVIDHLATELTVS